MTAEALNPHQTVPADEALGGVLEKGLAVLQLAAERGGVSAADVAKGLGLSRSSAYRLVDRLRSIGYLQESRPEGSYRLGPQLIPLGVAALNQLDVMDVAPPRLVVLAQEAEETVNLAVARRDGMIYVYQAEGPGAIKVTAHLGTRRPLNCSSLGKAYLAALPDDELETSLRTLPMIALTDQSITDPIVLRADILATRARGYATDREEVEEGVSCVGAALRDRTGRPIAAISVAGPSERMPRKRAAIVPLLLATAADISQRMGYTA